MKTPFELHLNLDSEYLIFEVTKKGASLIVGDTRVNLTLSQLNDIEMAARIVAAHACQFMEEDNG